VVGSWTESEVAEIRREFPALERYVYFATNGLGILPRRTVEALREWIERLSEDGIVAAFFHDAPLLSETRERVARFLGCDATEVAFCRNTSEGVLWAASSLDLGPGDEVLLVQGEYPANVLPWMAQEERGVTFRFVCARDRRVPPDLVATCWGEHTRVLAVSFVQYNSGFRADLAALSRTVHERGGILFCDAIQGLGALRLDVRQAGVDLLAAGTHKWLLGLQGLGIFYCRRPLLDRLRPVHVATGSLLRQGDPEDPDAAYEREFVAEARRYEEGTRNYLGIVALRCSVGLIEEIGLERIEQRVRELTDYLVEGARRRGCAIESPRGRDEWSGIVLFQPPRGRASASELAAAMHAHRIVVNAREGCLHAGVHFYNTEAEIDRLFAVLDEAG